MLTRLLHNNQGLFYSIIKCFCLFITQWETFNQFLKLCIEVIVSVIQYFNSIEA